MASERMENTCIGVDNEFHGGSLGELLTIAEGGPKAEEKTGNRKCGSNYRAVPDVLPSTDDPFKHLLIIFRASN